jgi:anthranilate synthase component 2/para-aminobenzoate synthetase component 2
MERATGEDRRMILVLDNYDSFTWNLVQALEAAGTRSHAGNRSIHHAAPIQCRVHRSDSLTLLDIEALSPQGIVLSPGPFGPDQAGICPDVVRHFGGRIPIMGVCLGMQVIATVAGARVVPSGRPMHGKASLVRHDGQGLLRGLPSPFEAARYHSLIVDPASVPSTLEITSHSISKNGGDGHVMGCRIPGGELLEGVLFHPESFLTEDGPRIFQNFVQHVVQSPVNAHVV